MPAAIPLIIMAAGTATSAYGAYKQGQQADDAASLQKQLMDRQGSMADIMTKFGQGQFSASKPALDKAMQYYMTLAGGNRGAVQSAIAPQVGSMTDAYSGAERQMAARMAAGPQRDQAMADLAKHKAGSIGMLAPTARNDAMGKLADLGGNAASRGLSAFGQASGALGGQQARVGQLFGMQQAGGNAWNSFGRDLFNTFGQHLMEKYGKTKANSPTSMGYAGNPFGMTGSF